MDEKFAAWLGETDAKGTLWSELEYLIDEGEDKRPFFGKADGLTVAVTDFVHLWTESTTSAEFQKRFKDLNPNLEADVGAMTSEIRDVVLGRRRDCKATVDKGDTLRIGFTSKFGGVPLRWKCVLRKADAETFYNEIVKPLLAATAHHRRRETALFELLATKDQEIEQRRKASETRQFRAREWSTNDLCSKEFIKSQRNLRPDTLSRTVASNEVYALAYRADIYLRDHPDSTSEDGHEEALATRSKDAKPEATAAAVKKVKVEKVEEGRTSPKKSADAAVVPEPSPPPQRKKKKLRL